MRWWGPPCGGEACREAMSGGSEPTPRLEEEPSLADGAQASDSSKLKTLLSILKRTVGVKDLASLYVVC